MAKDEIRRITERILEANDAYANGSPIMEDTEYDNLIDQLERLDPDNELLHLVGQVPKRSRMENLPIHMASLDKVKSINDLMVWAMRNKIPMETMMSLTPKYDGLSLCVVEDSKMAWTRGDGVVGQRSDDHLRYINSGTVKKGCITFGEVIISRYNFTKYSSTFKTGRNFVAGKMNSDIPDYSLHDIDYLRYGYVDSNGRWNVKSHIFMLCLLNYSNPVPVFYESMSLGNITEQKLIDLYNKWSENYAIDGIVIHIDNLELAAKLGRNQSTGNPKYAVAYKGDFEEKVITGYKDTIWQIGKTGAFVPVVSIEPVMLDGVTVDRVTAYNARYLIDNGIGKDSVLVVKRSGFVIPKIVEVMHKTSVDIPKVCPYCNHELHLGDVDLICENDECDGIVFAKIVAFFNIVGVEDFRDGSIKKLFECGFNTLPVMLEAIYDLDYEDVSFIDGMGERTWNKIKSGVRQKLTDIPESRLMHASCCFDGLGEQTFDIINDILASGGDIEDTRGIGEITACSYYNGIERYQEFKEDIERFVKIMVVTEGDLKGWNVVMSGFRDRGLQDAIIVRGGRVSDNISKKTTHLIIRIKGSGSTKEKFASNNGIPIFDVQEFKEIIGYDD